MDVASPFLPAIALAVATEIVTLTMNMYGKYSIMQVIQLTLNLESFWDLVIEIDRKLVEERWGGIQKGSWGQIQTKVTTFMVQRFNPLSPQP